MGDWKEAVRLYFLPVTRIHRKAVVFAWLLTVLWLGMAFYSLNKKLDSICAVVECVEVTE